MKLKNYVDDHALCWETVAKDLHGLIWRFLERDVSEDYVEEVMNKHYPKESL